MRAARNVRIGKRRGPPAFVPVTWFGLLSFEDKQALRLALDKLANNLVTRSQKIRDHARGAIADAQPNELGWKAEDDGSLVEICILRNNSKSMFFGPVPNDTVVGFL